MMELIYAVVAWFAVVPAFAVVLGLMIRERDRQIPIDVRPAPAFLILLDDQQPTSSTERFPAEMTAL